MMHCLFQYMKNRHASHLILAKGGLYEQAFNGCNLAKGSQAFNVIQNHLMTPPSLEEQQFLSSTLSVRPFSFAAV